MNSDGQSLFLQKSLKVIVPLGINEPSFQHVSTVARNLQSLGFGLSSALLERLSTLPEESVVEWYEGVLPTLKKMVGAHRTFMPMYPNFPQQVMNASQAELFFNAMTNYYGFMLSDMLNDPTLIILPSYEKEIRPFLDELHELRWLELGVEEDFDRVFTRLLASNGSLSATDKEIAQWFAANRNVSNLLPQVVPQKETLAFLVAKLSDPACLVPLLKSATDVLRVAVAMSDGDVSLAEPTKFRNLSKKERRYLLECLENCGSSMTEDMLRWRERWIRLGERLHPGDYKNRFPQSLAAFDVLRNGCSYETFNSRIEAAFVAKKSDQAIDILIQRPGDFARRLDHALRTLEKPDEVATAFLNVASKVSTPVLLQLWHHFLTRNDAVIRAFFPKGNAAKVQVKEGRLPRLQTELVQQLVNGIRDVLVDRFRRLPSLGKVHIGENLKEQIVPFSQRSASRAIQTVSRGSSFDLPLGQTIRFFCWWKNLEKQDSDDGRVDIDLSASMFDSNWQYVADVSYYNLRQGRCFHSGDITSAPNGACEFIDMDLPFVLESNARYIVMSIMCFTGQSFLALPECFGGWMMRQKPESGEIFDPRTLKDKVDITGSTRTCVPVIVDVQDRKVYWADLALKGGQINNAARNSVGMSQIGKVMVALNKPSLFDLFLMHAEARGTLVNDEAQADTIFDVFIGTVTAFDTDKILSEFLA